MLQKLMGLELAAYEKVLKYVPMKWAYLQL